MKKEITLFKEEMHLWMMGIAQKMDVGGEN